MLSIIATIIAFLTAIFLGIDQNWFAMTWAILAGFWSFSNFLAEKKCKELQELTNKLISKQGTKSD